jgi:hypothetical protein
LSFKNAEGKLARWLELLSYDFKIKYRVGRSHNNTDVLSRRPCLDLSFKHCGNAEAKYASENIESVNSIQNHSSPEHCCVKIRSGQLEESKIQSSLDSTKHKVELSKTYTSQEMQSNDLILNQIRQWVQSKMKPSWGEISGKSEVCKYYWARFDSLVIKKIVP